MKKKFSSTRNYIASSQLIEAVNAAVILEKPLLVKGEPGTGKTMLAEEIASTFNTELISWHIKSTTKAQQGLYDYDAVSRLRDSQLGNQKVHNIRNYINKGVLWKAFTASKKPVLLIDEIDKADIEFPNDLLQELEPMGIEILANSSFNLSGDPTCYDLIDGLMVASLRPLKFIFTDIGLLRNNDK